jgi:hypothetical protein
MSFRRNNNYSYTGLNTFLDDIHSQIIDSASSSTMYIDHYNEIMQGRRIESTEPDSPEYMVQEHFDYVRSLSPQKYKILADFAKSYVAVNYIYRNQKLEEFFSRK